MKKLLTLSLAIVAFIGLSSATALSQGSLDSTVKSIFSDVESLKKLKISGYIQAQFMNAEANGARTYSGGNFPAESHNIFKIRRGRIRADYKTGIVGYTLQMEANETGISLKDAFVEVTDPWLKAFSLRGGNFKVGIGNELGYAADARLSPESARMIQVLIPGEYDLGAQLTIRAPKGHVLNPFSLTAQMLMGNGGVAENDNQKNFTARLLYDQTFGKFSLAVAASTYQGGVWQGNANVWEMDGTAFKCDSSTSNIKSQADRQYYIGDLRVGYVSPIGKTALNGEFWTGNQPGNATASASPSTTTLPTGDTYIRPFQGALVQLSHEIAKTNLAVAVKYDFYDANTKVSGDEVGLNGTNAADLSYNTIGVGLIFLPSTNLRFTLWYDIVSNEKTENLAAYKDDIKDNVLTLRMQIKF
ncbi:MAG: hypothetical protein LBO69_08870 [Ignavibacteria bacterium]|jgi:hypothetical protein|nr:hypothetical protein [Ignavibacteria bacterium]